MSHVVGTAVAGFIGTVDGMPDTSDLTDEQWAPEPVFTTPGQRGPEHAPDLRWVVVAMLQVACIASTLRHLSRARAGRRALPAAA